ncbi:hypothetical protein VP01_1166g2 [Puccinia sorghi]|uniref:Uncharacterized protein n=1 Tax=Puccinia sorghi TaxID=27349 RepID=A0A0L6VRE5_9BASI|nr:hypothetical protein VP01_1166g2 [Puccinia sorghi]
MSRKPWRHVNRGVDLTEDARIEKYQRGLNFKIVKQAMSISVEYMQTKSLAEKMRFALLAAQQLDQLALHQSDYSVPGRNQGSAPIYHHPNFQPRDPNAMDIDAFSTHNKPIFDQIRAICRERRLCFRCLQPLTPPDHTGSVNCPNPRMTTEQRNFGSSCILPRVRRFKSDSTLKNDECSCL